MLYISCSYCCAARNGWRDVVLLEVAIYCAMDCRTKSYMLMLEVLKAALGLIRSFPKVCNDRG